MGLSGFLFVFFLNVTFGFQACHLKMLKIIQYDFWTGVEKKFSGEQRTKTLVSRLCFEAICLVVAPWKYDELKTCIFALEVSLFRRSIFF